MERITRTTTTTVNVSRDCEINWINNYENPKLVISSNLIGYAILLLNQPLIDDLIKALQEIRPYV